MANHRNDEPIDATRRRTLTAMGLALGWPGLAGALPPLETGDRRRNLVLWYERPARQWVEAVPVGNGRLGAMVFGRVTQERLQLNEDTLYGGGPYRFDNPGFAAALPVVRKLIAEGNYKEATERASKSMISQPATQMPYGAAGDLLLDFHGIGEAVRYHRALDLDEASAVTQFESGATRYRRETFASNPDGVIVMRLTADGPGALDFDVGYRHPREAKYGAVSPPAEAGPDIVEQTYAGERPASLSIRADGPNALLIEGRNIDSAGVPGALRYAVRVLALGDGVIETEGERLRVRGARDVMLLVDAATSFVDFRRVDGDPVKAVRNRLDAAARKTHAQLRSAHVKAHAAAFARLSVRIGKDDGTRAGRGADSEHPVDARIAAAPKADDAALASLAVLYLQYGRYLLLSSSRPGSQPANLQGIWNEGVNPPWGGKFTININTEMNYWPAEAANLPECVEPVVRMVEELAASGAVTARKSYGARGWVAHHNTDLWRATAPIDGPNWGLWPCGGAWLCKTLWDHYDYRPDAAYLARIYPLLKGASLFFVDVLVEDPKGRGLVTSPSISPENEHHPGVALCAGPAMDRQIVRDLFGWTLAAHRLVKDPDAAFARTVGMQRARLAPDRIGAQGQLQEWLEDWDPGAPEQQHRHVSHLYAVYPSDQINVRDTPDMVRAARVTLDTRGDMSTGWATAWRLALWARMGDGERAYGILRGLLGPERTYPNMFDAHPPFQIDGNFGGAAGMLEMLVQSWGGEIRLLPALPKAWPDGELRGVRARGGVELDLAWADGRPARLALRGAPGQRVAVRVGDALQTVVLDARGHAARGFGMLARETPRTS